MCLKQCNSSLHELCRVSFKNKKQVWQYFSEWDVIPKEYNAMMCFFNARWTHQWGFVKIYARFQQFSLLENFSSGYVLIYIYVCNLEGAKIRINRNRYNNNYTTTPSYSLWHTLTFNCFSIFLLRISWFLRVDIVTYRCSWLLHTSLKIYHILLKPPSLPN